jgi:hypothetical protein
MHILAGMSEAKKELHNDTLLLKIKLTPMQCTVAILWTYNSPFFML